MPAPAAPAAAPSGSAPKEPGAGEQLHRRLERLAALHRSGALTGEEFAKAEERPLG
ncbi:hypothetical protein ACWCXH_16650 [Kitasatospora sp. NPDC001660]